VQRKNRRLLAQPGPAAMSAKWLLSGVSGLKQAALNKSAL